MAVTTHRPTPLPHNGGNPAPDFTGAAHSRTAPTPVPVGATRMQPWHIDPADDRRKRMPYPVPVDNDNHRTPHVLHQCPKMRNTNGGGKERCPVTAWMLPGEPRQFCQHHGEPLTPPKTSTGLVDFFAEVRRLHGRSAAAWALPASVVTVDMAAAVAHLPAAGVAAFAPAAAGATYLHVKRTLTRRAVARNRIEVGQRTGKRVRAIHRQAQRAALTAGETSLWAAALAATDITTLAGQIVAAFGLVRWAVGAYRWWADADARRAAPTPITIDTAAVVDTPPVEAPNPVQLHAVTTFATLIGCTGGPLAGTELVDWKQLPACDVGANIRTRLPNWTAKVVAKIPGSINMREQRPCCAGGSPPPTDAPTPTCRSPPTSRTCPSAGFACSQTTCLPKRNCGPAPPRQANGSGDGPASAATTTAKTFGTSGGRRQVPPTT